MNRIVFPSNLFEDLRAELLKSAPNEAAAILLAGRHSGRGGERLLVRESIAVSESGYLNQGPGVVSITPKFLNSVLRRARTEGWSLILAHTHPFATEAWFSAVDDNAETTIVPVLRNRAPNRPHGFAVLTESDVSSRVWLGSSVKSKSCVVNEVGRRVRLHKDLPNKRIVSPEFDRNVRALGEAGQAILSSLTIGIVGLGGLGSIVLQELAHLGVNRFILIDHDRLERSNLNRVVGARKSNLRKPKVEVAAKMAADIRPRVRVNSIVQDVAEQSALRQLLGCDAIFCCTDSHGSRAVLNQLAYQYVIPTFDLGVQIDAPDGRVRGITGRVQMLAPGLPCLVCQNLLDPELVRRDLMTEAQRHADPYIVGAAVPQPAVISLNGSVSSLAVTMFLSAMAGLPVESRHQIVLFDRGTVRSVRSDPDEKCVVCSLRGAFAQGDLYPFPGRPGGD